MPPSPAVTTTGTATILFTDLVGSTTLRTQLGEERAEAHRRAQEAERHFESALATNERLENPIRAADSVSGQRSTETRGQ